MGDANADVESRSANDGMNLQVDILKVEYHGSVTSSSSVFLSEVHPKISIIEVGSRNSYGHPASAILMLLGLGGIGGISHRPEWRGNGDNRRLKVRC